MLDYLTDEIIAVQRDDVREFLMETSIPDRLSAPLCDGPTDIVGVRDYQASWTTDGKTLFEEGRRPKIAHDERVSAETQAMNF